MLQKAVTAGISAAAVTSLASVSARRSYAQDATPAPDPSAGNTIVVPQGLRTDLSGQSIRAVLADSTSADGPFLEAALAKFGEATGITVEFIRGETSATDRLQAYRQEWAAESADTDVFQIDVIWPGVVAEHAIDLSESLAELATQQLEALIANNTIDGALVGMPWFTDAGLFYYRTDLLEKYALPVPATWAELATSAQTIQDGERAASPNFAGFLWQGNVYEGLTCNGLEWQVSNGGGNIVEPDGTVSVNNEQAIASFDRARTWVNTISPEGVTTYQEPDCQTIWVAGNAAFCRQWPGMYSASQDSDAIAGKVAVAPLPMGGGDGARNAATLGGWQMMVSRYSEKQDAALEFVKYMCSPEVQRSFMLERSHAATVPALYEDAEVQEASPFFASLGPVFQGGAVARPSSVTGALYPEVSSIYFTELNQVLTGSKSGADAAAAMESQITELIEGDDL